MDKKVSIFYLAEPKYGGWPSFTAHLIHGLYKIGCSVSLFKIGKKTEGKLRNYGRGVKYQNLSLEMAVNIAKSSVALISAASPKRADEVFKLLEVGASIIIHDPTELKGDMPSVLSRSEKPVIVIRQANVSALIAIGIEAHYVPHPYMSVYGHDVAGSKFRSSQDRRYHAVSYSRVDWDKHTDIICEANDFLSNDRTIAIYGFVNRMYAFHKLEKAFPSWESHYNGRFPDEFHAGVEIASKGKYAVDMSQIKGDGGGTQYTFFEAWDAGCRLILHKGWLTGNDEVAGAARFIEDGSGLAEILCDDDIDWDPIMKQAESIMKKHDSERIAKLYVEIL